MTIKVSALTIEAKRVSSKSVRFAAVLKALRLAILLSAALAPAAAWAAETASGLPLPRFVTTRSNQINLRVGPGPKYDVIWIYKIAGTPVEIIKEFDTWRKIRDVDGTEGWVHQSMLTGGRAGYVAPWVNDPKVALRTASAPDSGVVAWLTPRFPVKISSCESGWCAVTATDHPQSGHPVAYNGYLPETDIWGVYQGESFD
jgi:SH3-like domain-containing protein